MFYIFHSALHVSYYLIFFFYTDIIIINSTIYHSHSSYIHLLSELCIWGYLSFLI